MDTTPNPSEYLSYLTKSGEQHYLNLLDTKTGEYLKFAIDKPSVGTLARQAVEFALASHADQI